MTALAPARLVSGVDCTCGSPLDESDHFTTCPASPDFTVCACGEVVDLPADTPDGCALDHCSDHVGDCLPCARARRRGY